MALGTSAAPTGLPLGPVPAERGCVLKLLLATIAFLVAWPLSAAAQGMEHRPAQGYVFFAPGVATGPSAATIHFGGGGERFLYRGLSAGVEVGYMALWSQSSDGQGVGMANASYHFRPRGTTRPVEPFVTGGYTLFFRHGTASGGNFGGGLNFWLASRAALRIEARAPSIGMQSRFGGPDPLVEFRVGITWR